MMRDPQTDLEVCEKATRGPWEYLSETGYAGDYPYSKSHRVKIGNKTLTVSCHIYGWEGEKEERANAELIALAREALPWWIKRVQELEAENKLLKDRLFLKCEEAETLPNGQCRGFQVSHFDDEPIEQCKKCQKFELYEAEAENWDEEGEQDD